MASLPVTNLSTYFNPLGALARFKAICPYVTTVSQHYNISADEFEYLIGFMDGSNLHIIGTNAVLAHLTANPNQGASHGLSGQTAQAFPSNPNSPLAGVAGIGGGLGQFTSSQYNQLAQYQANLYAQQPTSRPYASGGNTLSHYQSAFTQAYLAAAAEPVTPLKTEGFRLGELTAWRGWIVTAEGWLKSMTADVLWAPGEPMDGKTSSTAEHNGVYCYKKLRDFLKNHASTSMIYGRVHVWGDIIEHELGYRAEYAKIVSLEGWTQPARSNPDTIAKVRAHYQLAA